MDPSSIVNGHAGELEKTKARAVGLLLLHPNAAAQSMVSRYVTQPSSINSCGFFFSSPHATVTDGDDHAAL